MAGRATCLIAVLSASWCLQSVVAQDASATVTVSSSRELLSALENVTVATIVLGRDVELGPEFKQYESSPLQIQRNVTITGPAGSSAAIDDMPMIDLEYRVGIMELCSNCNFVFLWVNIAHENRIGTGLGMSTFLGQPGSRLERLGGVGLRDACTSTPSTLKVLNNTKRSALFPSPPGGQQLGGSTDFVFRGKPYQDMLKIIDLSGEIVMAQVSQTAFVGGYSIRRRNATRLCDHIVSGQCLTLKMPEECIAELLPDPKGGGSPPRRITEVAVPAAIGGLLLLGVCAAVVWLRTARKRRRPATLKPVTSGALAGRGDAELNQEPSGMAGAAYGSDGSRKEWPKNGSFPPALVGGALGSGFNQLLWSSSAPNMDMQDNDSIELGVLLGAGSFGRVYKASWCGLDVAVKVIQHDSTSVREVATEVTLMLNLNHPNIVRAYHCRTKQLTPSQPPSLPSGPLPTVTGSSIPKSGDSGASWRMAHGPAAAHYQTGSAGSSGTPSQRQQQQQQQHVVVLPAGSSGTEERVSQATASTSTQLQQHSDTLAAPPAQPLVASWQLVPSAASAAPRPQPPPTPAQPPPPPVPGTTASDGLTGAGATGSSTRKASAWDRHVQDLDVGPCFRQQRQMQWQQQGPVQGLQQAAAAGSTPHPSASTSGASRTPDELPTSDQAAAAAVASAVPSNQATDSSAVALLCVDDPGENSSSSGRHCTASIDGTMCETWLVLELCDRGTLARQASQWQPQVNEQDMLILLHMLRDVARGLKRLQAQSIIHADLNAHNVLVTSSPVAAFGLVAKISDLGLSRVLKQHATHRTTSTVGMMSHQPPELLRDGRMSPAVDIYSFGIMMYELFTRQVAYARMRVGQLYHQVVLQGVRPTPPQDMPEDYELLMRRCWAAEPAERPSVDMLLECLGLMIEDRQPQPDDDIKQQH